MRVLQLGPYPPPEGGISRNMLAIREELLINGHQCSIIATAKSSQITPEADVFHPRSSAELVKLLKELQYDVLHLHIGGGVSLRILGLMAACAFFGRGKSVLTFHSGGYAVEKHKTASHLSRDAAFFRAFDKIIAVNPLMVEMFEKYGVRRDKLHLIYPFVWKNPDKTVEIPFELKDFAEKHSPFLLAVCLLEDTYDIFSQIDALETVLGKFPNAGLLIAGSGVLETELKKTIASKKYAEKILLAGDVEHKITLHLIKKADILLRTTKFDGDAISVREALFLNTPVIATDNKMRPEGVNLIPVGDKNALAAKIIEIAAKPKTPKAENNENKENISAVLDVYREIAE